MALIQKLKKIHLTQQIIIAFVLAIVAGCLLQGCPTFVNAFIKPFGVIFLNLLKFIVAPLVLLSIVVGIPVECVAVVAGVDRIIDMGRTVIVQRIISRKAKIP